MTGTTISGARTTELLLTKAGQNPVLVTTSGSVLTTSGAAILATNAKVGWKVSNQGRIAASAGAGIAFDNGGRGTSPTAPALAGPGR